MSGPDNLRGIDYQVSFSTLQLITTLEDEAEDLAYIRFDSLTDDEEDLTIGYSDGRILNFQVKKRSEGFQWTLATLGMIIRAFDEKGLSGSFILVTNVPANADVSKLKESLQQGIQISTGDLSRLGFPEEQHQHARELLARCSFLTRYYPSDDDTNPAKALRVAIESRLLRGSFHLLLPISAVINSLWEFVYRAAEAGERLSYNQIITRLRVCGLIPATRAWARYPTPRHYYEHVHTRTEIKERLQAGSPLIVYGIGGTGKTSLLAAVSSELGENGVPVCWITLSELTSVDEFVGVVAGYARDLGLSTVSEQLRSGEFSDRPRVFAAVLSQYKMIVVIDKLEAANTGLDSFLSQIVGYCSVQTLKGGLIFSSRTVPKWWYALDDLPNSTAIPLGGLPESSARELLADVAVTLSSERRQALAAAVARHPQSMVMLGKLAERGKLHEADFAGATYAGLEQVRDWLLRQVISDLPLELRDALTKVSIFEYPPLLREAEFVVGDEARLRLLGLHDRDLVRIENDTVTVHDALRDVARSLLSPTRREELHGVAADSISSSIRAAFEAGGEVLFETGDRWLAHLEKLSNLSDFSLNLQYILTADPSEIDLHFDIMNWGFPLEFDDSTLESTWDRIDELLEAERIEERSANVGKSEWVEPPYQLKDFSQDEQLLIYCLARKRGRRAGTGYVPVMRANYAFVIQPLMCPYEHCIELSPYPGPTQSELDRVAERAEQQLSNAEELGLTQEQQDGLKQDLEYARTRVPLDPETQEDLEARRCFFWGHACPAGVDQAETCRSNDDFVWHTVPPGWEEPEDDTDENSTPS
jgi:hypothetical protein